MLHLKLDRATQLSNGTCGSKYSAHHSRSSGVLIPLSYLIPAVPKISLEIAVIVKALDFEIGCIFRAKFLKNLENNCIQMSLYPNGDRDG